MLPFLTHWLSDLLPSTKGDYYLKENVLCLVWEKNKSLILAVLDWQWQLCQSIDHIPLWQKCFTNIEHIYSQTAIVRCLFTLCWYDLIKYVLSSFGITTCPFGLYLAANRGPCLCGISEVQWECHRVMRIEAFCNQSINGLSMWAVCVYVYIWIMFFYVL